MSKIERDNADLVLEDFKKVIYNTVEGKRHFDIFYLAALREVIRQDPQDLSYEKINTITRIIKGNVKYLKPKDAMEILNRGVTGNVDRYLIDGMGLDYYEYIIGDL